MTSVTQWVLIAAATLYGFASGTGSLAAMAGSATAFFVVSFGMVQGYNGVDLVEVVRSKLRT